MKLNTIAAILCLTACLRADIISDVRAATDLNQFGAAERMIRDYRASAGTTPDAILAISWLGRGAQKHKQWEKALDYAAQTRELVEAELKKRPALDATPQLALALGASIEVQSHSMAATGSLSEAIAFLNNELRTWQATSMHARIQKNIHLLSLEGKTAPALRINEFIGTRPQPLSALRGKVLVLFFWAHWCSDCKAQAPILAQLKQTYGSKGLVVVGPTRRYGYVEAGAEANPRQELEYIKAVRSQKYGFLDMTVPVSEHNFLQYGSSSSPTLVVVDKQGKVRMYRPGIVRYEELSPLIEKLLRD
jgi:thiol-disulfide isomerase/thioredoxin